MWQAHEFRAIAISIYKEIDEILLKENKGHEIISPMPSYDTLEYKHFVGSYKSQWGIAEIKIKDDELLYSWIGSNVDWNDFTTKIHPTSKSNFTHERLGQNLLFTLKFNDDNEVIGKMSHQGNKRDYLEKIK